jgi:hypothetical protein
MGSKKKPTGGLIPVGCGLRYRAGSDSSLQFRTLPGLAEQFVIRPALNPTGLLNETSIRAPIIMQPSLRLIEFPLRPHADGVQFGSYDDRFEVARVNANLDE